MRVELPYKLYIAILFLALQCGAGQEMGRKYIFDHQQYYKGMIAAQRGFCQLANSNFEAFKHNYKEVGKEYWEDRIRIKM